jgi:hypothetical protein
MFNIKDDIKTLNQHRLPESLKFNKPLSDADFDIEKIKYNSFHRDFEYYEKRFEGHQSIPGFDKVIQKMADDNKDKSLLDAILERKELIENIDKK